MSAAPLTTNLYQVHLNAEISGGAYPFTEKYYLYFNKNENRQLAHSDIFDDSKIQQLAQFLWTHTDSYVKNCSAEFSIEKLSRIVKQAKTIGISASGLSIGLELPKVCQTLDDPVINWNLMMPYLTEAFKAEIVALK